MTKRGRGLLNITSPLPRPGRAAAPPAISLGLGRPLATGAAVRVYAGPGIFGSHARYESLHGGLSAIACGHFRTHSAGPGAVRNCRDASSHFSTAIHKSIHFVRRPDRRGITHALDVLDAFVPVSIQAILWPWRAHCQPPSPRGQDKTSPPAAAGSRLRFIRNPLGSCPASPLPTFRPCPSDYSTKPDKSVRPFRGGLEDPGRTDGPEDLMAKCLRRRYSSCSPRIEISTPD